MMINLSNIFVQNTIGGLTSEMNSSSHTDTTKMSWTYFDESSYILGSSLKNGEDPFERNKFNQMVSDHISSSRDIPDTRNQR